MRSLLLLEVLQKHVAGLRLLSPVLNDNARGGDDLASSALAVDLAETGPLAKSLGLGNLDQVDAVLGAEGLNQLGVGILSAVGSKHAQMGPAAVQSLGALVQATGEAIMDERLLQDDLKGGHDVHGTSLLDLDVLDVAGFHRLYIS